MFIFFSLNYYHLFNFSFVSAKYQEGGTHSYKATPESRSVLVPLFSVTAVLSVLNNPLTFILVIADCLLMVVSIFLEAIKSPNGQLPD